MSEQAIFTADMIEMIPESISLYEGLRRGCLLLERKGLIELRYLDGIVSLLQEYGPYMAIAPHIFFAHARPEAGALGTGASLLLIQEGITVGHPTHDPIHILITLASESDTAHLDIMAQIVAALQDSNRVDALLKAVTLEEAIMCFGR